MPPSVAIVKKLVLVLEAIERLPVYTYDSPGSSLNVQVSNNIIKPTEQKVNDTTVEPLLIMDTPYKGHN